MGLKNSVGIFLFSSSPYSSSKPFFHAQRQKLRGGEKAKMNALNVGLGVVAALLYAFLGYAAQDKPFSWKKFLRTVAIGTFSALGLDFTGMTFDVYTALVGPTTITVWLQKLIDTAKPTLSETSPK